MRNHLLGLVAGILVALGAPAHAQEPIERFDGSIVDVGATGRMNRNAFFSLTVYHYTPEEKVDELELLLKEKGQVELVKAMSRLGAGSIRIDQEPGHPVGVIRVFETEKGRMIRAWGDQSFHSLLVSHLAMSDLPQYPLAVLQIELDENGEGEGALLGGLKAYFDEDDELAFESTGGKPFKLVNVKAVK